MIGAPVVLLSLVEGDRQFFKSCLGLAEPWATRRSTPLSHSFCQHVVATEQPLIVEDARQHPTLRDNLAIPDLDVVAYAGWPVRAPDGSILGSFCVIDSQPRAWTAAETETLADIAASVNAEIALRHALQSERTAREEALVVNQHLRFMTEASALLSESLDPDRVLQDLADLAVPRLADWCLIDVVQGPTPHRQVVTHAEASQAGIAKRLIDYPLRPAGSSAAPGVLRDATPELVVPVTADWLRRIAQDDQHLRLLQDMRMDSAATVPLTAHGSVFGVMTFASCDQRRRYGPEHLEILADLGRHAGLAVANARLYVERDNVARTLQRTLLPPSLPDIPGVDLAVAYEPSGAGNEVGGDFYDLFRNPWGDWVFALGDVCGKGVDAAIVTGLVRHTIRAATTDHRDPVEVLRIINNVLLGDERAGGEERFCSLLLGVVTGGPDDRAVTVVSGGHPAPLLRRAAGGVEEPATAGMLLGLFDQVTFTPAEVTLRPGDLLLAYTDGVTEARSGHSQFGRQRVMRLLDTAGDHGPQQVITAVLDAVRGWQGGKPQDDIALLALQPRPRPRHERQLSQGAQPRLGPADRGQHRRGA